MAKASAKERNSQSANRDPQEPKEPKERKNASAAKSSSAKLAVSASLAEVQAQLERGDTRRARALLNKLAAASDTTEPDRSAARSLLDNLNTDRAAIAVALAVFCVIVLASIFALFTRHG